MKITNITCDRCRDRIESLPNTIVIYPNRKNYTREIDLCNHCWDKFVDFAGKGVFDVPKELVTNGVEYH